MKQGLVKGTLFITSAAIISKGLGILFRIPMQNIAGDQTLGIFTLVYPLYMVILTLAVAGIPLAISKLISEASAKGSNEEIQDIFKTASLLSFSFGFAGFLLLVILSTPISIALGGISTRPAIIAVAFSLLVAPYMAVYRGFFQGLGDMRQTAQSQIIEQATRVFFIISATLILVHMGLSSTYIAVGVMGGSVIGALASLLYLRWRFSSLSEIETVKRIHSFRISYRMFRRILKLSIPIAIGSLTMALLNLVDSFTIPFSLATKGIHDINEMYGIYGRGLSLVQIATVFSTSLVLPIIPAISSAIAKSEEEKTARMIGKAQKFNHLIAWPTAMGILALSLPLDLALFGDIKGSGIIALLGFSSIVNAFAVLGTGILTGMNMQKKAAFIVLGAVIIKIPLNIFLVLKLGLIGAALSSVIVFTLLIAGNSTLINKYYPNKNASKGVKTYVFGSCMAAGVVGLPTLSLGIESWTRLAAFGYVILSIVIIGMIYSVVIWRLQGLKEIYEIPLIGGFYQRVINRKIKKRG